MVPISLFSAAEKQELGKNPPPLNPYRKVLVSEVLPTIMAAEKGTKRKTLILIVF
jgi:hypothetical protein